MSVLARLDWIARQIDMGRMVHLHVGRAPLEDRCKLKILLGAPSAGMISPIVASTLHAMIKNICAMVVSHGAVDRGPRHSSGVAEVSIWISTPKGKSVAKAGSNHASAATREP